DLDIDARSQVQLSQRINRLLGRLEDIEQALVRADLELLTRLLVDVRRAIHGEAFDVRRRRNGPGDAATRLTHGLDDLLHRLIEQAMVVVLEPYPDLLVHGFVGSPACSQLAPALSLLASLT